MGEERSLIWQYDFENKRMASVPRTILQYRGKGMQLPVSVVLGPDGLYFAALLPNKEGKTPIYRITHDRGNVYPNKIGLDQSPLALIVKYGCRQCHKIGGKGGQGGACNRLKPCSGANGEAERCFICRACRKGREN